MGEQVKMTSREETETENARIRGESREKKTEDEKTPIQVGNNREHDGLDIDKINRND